MRDLSPPSGTSSALLLRLTAGLAATMLDWPAGSRTLPKLPEGGAHNGRQVFYTPPAMHVQNTAKTTAKQVVFENEKKPEPPSVIV